MDQKEPVMTHHNEQKKLSLDSTFIVNTLSALGIFFVEPILLKLIVMVFKYFFLWKEIPKGYL